MAYAAISRYYYYFNWSEKIGGKMDRVIGRGIQPTGGLGVPKRWGIEYGDSIFGWRVP